MASLRETEVGGERPGHLPGQGFVVEVAALRPFAEELDVPKRRGDYGEAEVEGRAGLRMVGAFARKDELAQSREDVLVQAVRALEEARVRRAPRVESEGAQERPVGSVLLDEDVENLRKDVRG